MKIKNKNHYSEEQCEMIHEILHIAEKKVEEAKTIYFDTQKSSEEKLRIISYMLTQVATICNIINETFKYEMRDDNGNLYTQTLFSKIFYYDQKLRIEKYVR